MLQCLCEFFCLKKYPHIAGNNCGRNEKLVQRIPVLFVIVSSREAIMVPHLKKKKIYIVKTFKVHEVMTVFFQGNLFDNRFQMG